MTEGAAAYVHTLTAVADYKSDYAGTRANAPHNRSGVGIFKGTGREFSENREQFIQICPLPTRYILSVVVYFITILINEGVMMSVRATNSLIADTVIAPGVKNSPRMVVQDIDADNKTVTTIWFSDTHEAQTGVFPASSLERAPEDKKAAPVAPVKPTRRR